VPYLVASVLVLAVLVLLDLVLTLGVVRRLREHTELLADRSAGPPPAAMPPVGTTVGDFAATTTDGEPVSRDLLAGETVVCFFAPGCGPCREQAPAFVEYAGAVTGGRRQVLAVVLGEGEEVLEMAGQLDAVARVVVEPPGGPLSNAFHITSFPAMGLVDDTGTVIADRLPLPALPDRVRV
jgi:thiol-disulfide isomerase/thioredoxin